MRFRGFYRILHKGENTSATAEITIGDKYFFLRLQAVYNRKLKLAIISHYVQKKNKELLQKQNRDSQSRHFFGIQLAPVTMNGATWGKRLTGSCWKSIPKQLYVKYIRKPIKSSHLSKYLCYKMGGSRKAVRSPALGISKNVHFLCHYLMMKGPCVVPNR